MVACVCVCAGVTTFGASQSAVTETAAQRDDDGGRVDFQYSLFLLLIVHRSHLRAHIIILEMHPRVLCSTYGKHSFTYET